MLWSQHVLRLTDHRVKLLFQILNHVILSLSSLDHVLYSCSLAACGQTHQRVGASDPRCLPLDHHTRYLEVLRNTSSITVGDPLLLFICLSTGLLGTLPVLGLLRFFLRVSSVFPPEVQGNTVAELHASIDGHDGAYKRGWCGWTFSIVASS